MFDLLSSQLFALGLVDAALGSLLNILFSQVRSSRRHVNSSSLMFRMTVMILKGLLILYPLSTDKSKYSLRCRQRGSYFALIEYSSQYYISLLAIRPWIEFLLDQNDKSFYFSTFLFVLYLLFKVMSR